MPSRTSWWWSRTYMTDDADVRDKNVPVGRIPSLRNHPNRHIIYKNDPQVKADFVVKVPDLYN